MRIKILATILLLSLCLPVCWAESFIELFEMAQNGDATAMSQLGRTYKNGDGVAVDDVEAVKWFRLAGESGWPSGYAQLGQMYIQGAGVERDYGKAYMLFHEAIALAEALDRPVSASMPKIFLREFFLDGTPYRDIGAYLRKADAGDIRAQYEVGLAYLMGLELKHDLSLAQKWLGLAAEKGDLDAQLFAGFAYIGMVASPGSEKYIDEAKGLYWLNLAAERGSAMAWALLGDYYAWIENEAHDMDKAEACIISAARMGVDYGLYSFAREYEEGCRVSRNLPKALELYGIGAELGNYRCMKALAAMYAQGRGVKRDDAVALQWNQKAADVQEREAWLQLGRIYGNADPEFQRGYCSSDWRAAAAGLEGYEALYLLADICSQRPLQAATDYTEAYRWYLKAARGGVPEAQYRLGALYQSGQGVAQDYGKAAKWYAMAAEQNYMAAQYALGILYLQGQGVVRDDVAAYVLFAKAFTGAGTDDEERFLLFRYKYKRALDSLTEGMTLPQIQQARNILTTQGIPEYKYL